MRYSGPDNTITIDIDEARTLARKQMSWNQDTLEDAKIKMAKATLELFEAARSDARIGRFIAYGDSREL